VSDIGLDELVERLEELTLIDVRAPSEYDGSFGAPCDPRQGHIPGARHLQLEELMTLRDEELHDRLGLVEGSELVAYCHSGSRSALAVQILVRLGYDARNYAGSWHEWSRTELPIES
jgi:thiosulfate/3-mercaptopyruvate sulfurtransferase